jgi:Protein kinase domain
MAKMHSKGDVIADRFEVLEYLGSGGIGEVYKVREGKQEYALKALLPSIVPGFVDVEKIQSNTPKPLPGHSVVVFPKEVFESEGVRYILSDYIAGWNLRTIIDGRKKDGKTLDLLEAGLFIHHLLGRMSALPPTIVHGHLKPENLMYLDAKSPDESFADRVWITDIGLHRNLAFSKYAWLQLSKGSAYNYLAPEYVTLGGRVDRRSDIYSIGALAYELISGKAPGKEYRPLKESGLAGPEEIDAVLARSLSQTPEERFSQFQDFQDQWRIAIPELDRVIDESPALLTSVDLFTGEAAGTLRVDRSYFEEIDAFGQAGKRAEADSVAPRPVLGKRGVAPAEPFQIPMEEEVRTEEHAPQATVEEEWVTEEEEVKPKKDFKEAPHYRQAHRTRRVGCLTYGAFVLLALAAAAWFWF